MGIERPSLSTRPGRDGRIGGASEHRSDAIEARFRVGKYTCSMIYPLPAASGPIQVTWEPEIPRPRTLTAAELAQYLAGRDALIAEIARLTGQNILMVDL